MALKAWLLVALALIVTGLVCLGQGSNGQAGVTAGWPVSSTSIKLSIAVTGWWAVAGGLCTVLGSVLLIAGIVRLMFFERGE